MSMLPITFVIFLFLNIASTLLMTGIIVFVQIVHYPLFYLIPENEMPAYASRHQFLTSLVVMPLMLIETVTAVWLALDPLFSGLDFYFYLGVLLLAIIWASTLFLQIPCHNKLLSNYDRKAIRFLHRSNWIRTFAWLGRSCLMLYVIYDISQQCLPR